MTPSTAYARPVARWTWPASLGLSLAAVGIPSAMHVTAVSLFAVVLAARAGAGTSAAVGV